MLYMLVRFLFAPLFWLIYRPRILGSHNLRVKGKAIYVCNHISMMDPIVVTMISPRFVHFMAKAELFSNPIGNLFFRSLLAFPVNRKQADMASLKNAMRVLDQGKVFGIFPEGKRSITNDIDVLEKGAAFLATRSGAPIIPIYIHPDSFRKWHVRVAVGEAIQTSNLVASTPKSKLVDVVTDEIGDSIRRLRSQMGLS